MSMNKIGLIGPGRLGLCVALLLDEAGVEVTAIENNKTYLSQLQNRELITPEPEVSDRLKSSAISFSADIQHCLTEDHQTLLIYVPTPENEQGYDHSLLEEVLKSIRSFGPRTHKTNLVVGCTTLPGYLKNLAADLEQLNYQFTYSPAFIAQGSIIRNLQHPDMLLFGTADGSRAHAEEVFRKIVKNDAPAHHMDLTSAEITKLATNCFLTAKIAFANAIGDLAIKTGANYEAILGAIGADDRIGKKYLGYGFGFGGPCFPRDNRALNIFAKANGYNLQISEATETANKQHTEFQIDHYLQEYAEGEKVVFDHVTYKPGTDILQESQQLKIAIALAEAGREVWVQGDGFVLEKLQKKYGALFRYELKN
ncbi:nucleotide sugar dehydrogenase [Marinoscillum furvescens]|uniref:UDP-glucose 6-dehydrogenase n=1 Tax=Marinoscillum furvescens DSM 4134 TaxID=1122208 RepID=A0A3D9KY63_MARFU|nr:nucleotide sugar dehydrogenase [Marinoscillum furvescens]RED92299.1 nucleotide sugar dehydrogenase [Marinoscillum furvescens DSM 4134]